MHDHLRDLGRKIANDQSPYRLWSPHQIINVHNEVQGVSIRAIMVETSDSTSEVEQIPRCSAGGELIVNTNRGLRTLAPSSVGIKFLKVRGNDYNQVIGDLSRDLIWLQWFDIEQRNLASLKSLKNLRVLQLGKKRYPWKYRLEELWESESKAPVQLRELLLYSCRAFQGFPESIGCLRHLKKIVAHDTRVESLPDEFCLLESLEHLDLTDCFRLSLLPDNFGDLRNLRHLYLSSCSKLRKLPVSFKELSLLQHLNLWGCSELILESEMLETMAQLEYLDLGFCRQMEGSLRNIANGRAYLRELDLGDVREIPVNIGQLRKLQTMTIGSELLESLPTSIGDLSSLTSLRIWRGPKLECLPESLGRLNHLVNLSIENTGVRSLSIVMSNASTSEDCYPGLRFLNLECNKCLTEIDVQSTTLEKMCLVGCEMVRKIRGIDGLVNIWRLIIIGCPELEFLPSFARLACLQDFALRGCYGVKRIDGLEHCRALEKVEVHTRWKEAGIQSLEGVERLREVSLKANSSAGVEGCIQSIRNLQRRPEKIGICTRAVPDAASLLNCFDFSDLSVVGSIANQKLSTQKLLLGESPKPAYTARCILVCLVVNCESPQASLSLGRGDEIHWFAGMELEEGKWVFTTVITQPSKIFDSNNHKPLQIALELGYGEVEKGEVEKGLLVTGEEERVMEAFAHLCALLSD